MRFRGKSIRRKIVALLLVPLLSLTVVWGYGTYVTGREAVQLLDVAAVVDKIGYPLDDTIRVIQEERRQTAIHLADPDDPKLRSDLGEQRVLTDKLVERIRSAAVDEDVRDLMDAASARRLDAIVEAFDSLDPLRRSVDAGQTDRGEALDHYTRLIDPCFAYLMSTYAMDNLDADRQARALITLARGRELLSLEDALVASALRAPRPTRADWTEAAALIAQREVRYDSGLEALPDDEQALFGRFWNGPFAAPLLKAEKALIDAGAARPRTLDAKSWDAAAGRALDDVGDLTKSAGDRYKERVEPIAIGVLVKAVLVGFFGLLALVFALVMSIRIGRGLVRDLTHLRDDAHDAAGVRLPGVMRRLAAGEMVDVETEAPLLEHDRDEMGQVGQALNTLQRAAVDAAVKQAAMRRGVAEVFVNLARRSQVLLHKQLTLLDTMERRTEDTTELEDLFRLDHLTTRMRRHAEGLVILSGAAPSRQWRKPVQLMDVVRAAVAEVEDYERIEVRRLPRIAAKGSAIADLTHLIAELLENATVFSPPHTAVHVVGERVGSGFTLEIHDRGLGMTSEQLLEANLRLAETPEFELSDTDRLGLFVVSRLAQRQNVRVSLTPSPYGGTTAVVFIPEVLLTDASDTDGSGLRVDLDALERDADRKARLAQLPLPPKPLDEQLLGGPVELEAPLGLEELDGAPSKADATRRGVLGNLGGAVDIEDEDSERGGLFRPRRHLTEAAGEQHQQARETGGEGVRDRGAPGGVDGLVALPRRRAPKLVSSHGRTLSEPPRTELSRTAPSRTNAPRPEPARSEPAWAEPADAASAADDPSVSPVDSPTQILPRRVRQASLAPQLRTAEAPAQPAEPAEDRDADEVRSRMASLQRGWQRGRVETGETATPARAAEPAPVREEGLAPVREAERSPVREAERSPVRDTAGAPVQEERPPAQEPPAHEPTAQEPPTPQADPAAAPHAAEDTAPSTTPEGNGR
ncbi:nitrate- and nitrite sensing domain-containing protein [Streptomyces sp. TRM66268-LWL]|uniref:histidine kinase n=1 Tax=Streptomyces polyasparticus TaxID=2767826 RepID=A0ABR7SW31_9ACTN|nr:nitrate- and nitrite sensing domain-containing protein [Streptomyces polyasparticus]MBC9718543.1 nitrate- and nitrite sensing domain-containing protein [Streptomyces polyasparticus]